MMIGKLQFNSHHTFSVSLGPTYYLVTASQDMFRVKMDNKSQES